MAFTHHSEAPAGDGSRLVSTDPGTGEIVWTGEAATAEQVEHTVAASRDAFSDWSALSVANRAGYALRFADLLKTHRDRLAELISREVGKPLWESRTEVDAMIGKIPISIAALAERRQDTASESGGTTTATRYRPHGVVAVFGPLNFPGHLPNGHIVPALLAGNTVVFKPSEHAPAVAELVAALWIEAGLPPGVFNVVHGASATGKLVAEHPQIDGLFFTGSVAAGQALGRQFAGRPDKILALELGGNAPLIVHDTADIAAAVYHTVQSAFITSGQRCSCARRLILPAGDYGDAFIEKLIVAIKSIVVGHYRQTPEPFMGPLISARAAHNVLQAQQMLFELGGTPLHPAASPNADSAIVTPGLVDVTSLAVPDVETFGPLLQIIRVPDFGSAIRAANRTAFGLSAALLGGSRSDYERFSRAIRAGVVNWNRPTTAASSSLPFGGVGLSGNHRPSAYFAADYCSYAVASLESEKIELPADRSPGLGQ